jgi:hypothetical protein
MRFAKDLTRDDLVTIVDAVQRYLFLDCRISDDPNDSEILVWNPDREWDLDNFDDIADALAQFDLVPTEYIDACGSQEPAAGDDDPTRG